MANPSAHAAGPTWPSAPTRPKASGIPIQWFLLAPAVLLLFFTFLVPIVLMLRNSVVGPDGFTLSHFERFLTDPFYLRVLGRTFQVALIATLLTLIPGYVLAFNMTFHPSRRWRSFIIVVAIVPLSVNLVIRIFGWMAILSPESALSSAIAAMSSSGRPVRLLFSETAIIVGLVHTNLTFMIIAIAGALAKIDPYLLRAAQNLGASVWQTFMKVVLPLSLPGVLAGCLIVFALAISDFVTPALLGGQRNRMMTYMIYEQQLFVGNKAFAAAQTLILMVSAMLALAGGLLIASLYSRRWLR